MLESIGIDNETLISLGITAFKILVVFTVIITGVAYYSLAERRFSAFIQDRLGPNRCGPKGLLQPLADGVKFLTKEDIIPNHVDKILFMLAPILTIIPAFITFAVVPFGTSVEVLGQEVRLQIAEVNVGILYILGIVSLGVYGVVVAGYASNNKYTLLGGLRASAQMISYELSMALSIIGVLMVYETLTLSGMVAVQNDYISWLPYVPKWGVVIQPLGCLIFIVASFAETNRVPFDIPEAEAEIVAGYHLEYSSMKFSMFMMAEYSNMITSAAVVTTLFFGGWLLPWGNEYVTQLPDILRALAQIGIFTVKVLFFSFLFIWVRWTLPRFRYDQLMDIGWKMMLPLALLNIVATGFYYMIKMIFVG